MLHCIGPVQLGVGGSNRKGARGDVLCSIVVREDTEQCSMRGTSNNDLSSISLSQEEGFVNNMCYEYFYKGQRYS